jgi:hypothetical protein
LDRYAVSALSLAVLGLYFIAAWRSGFFDSENASASFGSVCVSATTYSRAQDVRVVPIVVPKFKLRNVERQIFAADLVISSDDTALGERPEALDRVRVDCADDVLADRVVEGLMREAVLEPLITGAAFDFRRDDC